MNKIITGIIALNALLIFGYINMGILAKEDTLKNGTFIKLKLAPVDPRSLMQGDYMRINYKFIERTRHKNGYVTFIIDENNIATYQANHEHFPTLKNNEIAIKYKAKNGRYFIGSDTFFFEEGSAKKYEQAKYGGLRVDAKGHALLTQLYDEKLKLLQ